MKKIQTRDEWLNEGHSYDNEIEKARMMQGSASDLVQWAQRKIAESRPENFKEGVISPIQEGRKSITKKHWDKADDDQREEWLLQAFSDPDDAMEYVELDWKDLPPQATSNMYESVNESTFKYDRGDYEEVETLFTKITGRPATDLDNNMFARSGGSADGDGEGWMLNVDDTPIPKKDKAKFVDAVMKLGKKKGWKIKQYGDDAVEIYESVNEGKYRIYMNSDADAPNEIDYEEYFGDGNKAAMIKKAKELAKDGKNQYGNPIKIAVTAEDDINDVVWTNESVNEGRASKNLSDKVKNLDDFFAGISRDKQVSLSVEGDWTDETDPYFQTGGYDDLKDDEAKYIIQFANDLAKRNNIKLPSELRESVNEGERIKPFDLGYRIPNIKRAIGDFKKGESIAATSKSGEGSFRIENIGDFDKYPTKDWDFAYINESENINEANYPSFQSNKNIRYQDMNISSGYWTYMGKEMRGKGMYKNVNNNQTYLLSSDDIEYFKKHLKDIEVMESEVNEGIKSTVQKLFKAAKKKLGMKKLDSPSDKVFLYARDWVDKEFGEGHTISGIAVDSIQDILYVDVMDVDTGDEEELELDIPKNLQEADEWSDDVKTKWTPPAGLFTEPANKIADVLHKESDDLDQAMSRLQFYINRGGKLLDAKAKANLETAKKLLQQKYA